MRRRKRIGTTRIRSLQRVRDRAEQRRARRPRSWGRRVGRRAERVRPWLQFLADVVTLVVKLAR